VPDKFDTIGEIPKLDLPIVVIHGTADEVIPFDHGKKVAAAAQRAKLVPVEGASHNAIPDLSGLVAAAIAEVTSAR
jgi:pimeloyl-ACP methyl ester carboxylesterase